MQDLQSAAEAGAPAHVHVPVTEVSPEEKARLQEVLFQAVQDSEECPICFDPMKEVCQVSHL